MTSLEIPLQEPLSPPPAVTVTPDILRQHFPAVAIALADIALQTDPQEPVVATATIETATQQQEQETIALMSDGNEQQEPQPQTTNVAPATPVSEKITCVTCSGEIENDQQSKYLYCSQKHFYCRTCTQNLLRLVFSEPHFHLPLKCTTCFTLIDDTIIENILESRQQDQYQSMMLTLIWSKDECLNENECLVHCPFCTYIEIHYDLTGDNEPFFLTCKHENCRKTSCLVCLHECSTDDIAEHLKCFELKDEKKLIDQAIEKGSRQQCPSCGLSGMKNDACMHMSCQKCQGYWCYFCGQEPDDSDMDGHNYDWQTVRGRCPMYLINICELDNRWPSTDYECLDYFHHHRTLAQLYDVYKQLGEEKLNRLNEQFRSLDGCGFTIDEIKEFDELIFVDYDHECQL
ncbi:unnamed protein product [Didymodactylos carnosus]|uniref:RING-type domain-containing protein n=1 Tax=Didymodactylos carnosus TaxID=1234261 RepID=A0A815P8S7_9BILA|nr:unnamed protein product [Didymodactylos carnosus]CAF4320396.1 unnamed protein product [Didymodactylos carnosus]